MNALIKLVEKYNGTLKRGEKSMKDFLQQYYADYIKDLRDAVNINMNGDKVKGMRLVGSEMYDMVRSNLDKIEDEANKIVEVLDLYGRGKIIRASNEAFELFDSLKEQLMIRYAGANSYTSYYRIRGYNKENKFEKNRKELFHIPYKLNYLAGPERYSVPGYPCLYLASQWQLCWYECGKPKQFMAAKFEVPTEENSSLKFIDFSGKPLILSRNFNDWFNGAKNDQNEKAKIQKYKNTKIYA